MDSILVTPTDPRDPISTTLIAELSKELAALYPDSHGGDGSGAFKPDDVLIPQAAFVVAWEGEVALGCGALRPMPDTSVAEIKRMFVRREYRGRGISRQILAALEAQAHDFGYASLILETGVHQIEAIGLYESAGYVSIDCYGIYAGEEISRCYRKKL
jgi:GNAT superfamily N-acetyltransferase